MAKEKVIKKIITLNQSYNNKEDQIEIGIDEVGRGPMFGRVYVAAAIEQYLLSPPSIQVYCIVVNISSLLIIL